MIAALVRKDSEYVVSFMILGDDKKPAQELYDPFGDTLPDDVFGAHFKHQNSSSQDKNVVVSLVAASNTNTPRIIVTNFIFNENYTPVIWEVKGQTVAYFDSIISDFEVAYPEEKNDNKSTGAYVIVVNDSQEMFTALALRLADKDVGEGSGGLGIYNRATFVNKLTQESINHKDSRLSCARELTSLDGPSGRFYFMDCLLLSNGVSSPEIKMQFVPVEEMEKDEKLKKVMVESSSLGRSIVNLPGFYPVKDFRSGNSAVVVWQRNQNSKASGENYLKENFLVGIYALYQGNQAVKIYTPAMLGADDSSAENVIISITKMDKKDVLNESQKIFLSVIQPVKSINKQRLLQAKTIRKSMRTIVNEAYMWDLTAAVDNKLGVSPSLDKFVVSTIKDEATPQEISLDSFVVNTNDPNPVIPSSSSSEEDPSSSSSEEDPSSSSSEEDPSSSSSEEDPSSSSSEEDPSSSSSEEDPSSSSSEEDPSSSSSSISESSASEEEEEEDPNKKKKGSGNSSMWIVYVLITLVLLIAVGVVIFLKYKNDQNLVYMKNVGDDVIEYSDDNQESMQEQDITHVSNDSRL